MLKTKLEPCGFRVLIKPDELSTVQQAELERFESLRAAGFEMTSADKKREAAHVHTGVIVEVGFSAWKGYDDGTPWASIGDRVYFAKYGGFEVVHEGQTYRVMNDEDVVMIIRNVEVAA